MVVMKFGGTSVADQAAIERLMAIVARQREKDVAAGDAAPGPVVVNWVGRWDVVPLSMSV